MSILLLQVQLSGKLKKLNYQLGLRYEDFHYKLTSPSLASSYSNNYANFFPSLNLSYNSNDHKSTFAFSFGRRIQRPGYSMLNPFLNVIALGQYNSGNPYLQPYFINKVELHIPGVMVTVISLWLHFLHPVQITFTANYLNMIQ